MGLIRKCLCFGAVLILASFANKEVSAASFSDDFSSGTLDSWVFIPGSSGSVGSWYVDGEVLVGEIGYKGFSFLVPDIGVTLTDFIFTAKVTNVNGVDFPVRFRASSDLLDFYQVDYRFDEPDWSQDNNNITLLWVDGATVNFLEVVNPLSFSPPFVLSQGVEHSVQIEVQGSNIKVYFDDVLVIDHTEVSPHFESGRFALANWAGDFNAGNVKNLVDDVSLTFGGQDGSRKIILLPGMGASWS